MYVKKTIRLNQFFQKSQLIMNASIISWLWIRNCCPAVHIHLAELWCSTTDTQCGVSSQRRTVWMEPGVHGHMLCKVLVLVEVGLMSGWAAPNRLKVGGESCDSPDLLTTVNKRWQQVSVGPDPLHPPIRPSLCQWAAWCSLSASPAGDSFTTTRFSCKTGTS